MPADFTQHVAPPSQYRTFTPADLEAWKRNGMRGTPGAPPPVALGVPAGDIGRAGRTTAAYADGVPGSLGGAQGDIGRAGPTSAVYAGGAPGGTLGDVGRAVSGPVASQSIPQPAPYNPPPVPSSGVPSFSPFGGQAPTPTPYGDFTAPDPLNFQQDPSYQFRFNEGQKALQRGAASRGTLLSGGFQKALQNYGQQAASQEYGNAFDRALAGYTTNRDTNAENYGQLMGQFRGNLDVWGGNSRGALDYAREARAAQGDDYERQYRESQDRQNYEQQVNDANAARQNAAAEEYARNVEEQRRATAAQNAAYTQMRGGLAPPKRSDLAVRRRTMARG